MNKNIKKFLELTSKTDSGWLEKAMWRQENEEWLDKSFNISIKILSKLRENKKNNLTPSNLIELSLLLGKSTSETRNMLRGSTDFNLSTIIKLEKVLNIKLI